jgi:UDP:flavonoid glycosyltransferase YjiC (YdhE family)
MRSLPDFVLVLSAGRGLELASLGEIPSNVLLYETIPAIRAMKRAELLITQGGGNIVKEAILQGVRLLTFPAAADQPGLSARLMYHKLSLRFPLERATSSTIRGLILDTLNDAGLPARILAMRGLMKKHQQDSTALQAALDRALRTK